VQDETLLLVEHGKTVKELSIHKECPERAENTTANTSAFRQIKASVDLGHWCLMRKAVHDGINPEKESESEQESEPY
jgi:hypothetical protein